MIHRLFPECGRYLRFIESEQEPTAHEPRLTRRRSLAALGGLLAGAAAGRIASAEAAPGIGPAGVASGAVTCVLTPELTEGPYYIAGEQTRRDITEGKPGVRLALTLKVVDASSCAAISGALVDIWHCDASGVYSGFGGGGPTPGGPGSGPGGGQPPPGGGAPPPGGGGPGRQAPTNKLTFLRGSQHTDRRGVATFLTIYPGWYAGRTVHIHVKVHLGGNVVHTGQLFFPDTFTDGVYAAHPYSSRPNRNPRNRRDSIYVNGGRSSVLALAHKDAGVTGAITLGVHRS